MLRWGAVVGRVNIYDRCIGDCRLQALLNVPLADMLRLSPAAFLHVSAVARESLPVCRDSTTAICHHASSQGV